MRLTYSTKHIFKYQPPAVLNQAGPVQDTYYEIGGVGFWADKINVRIYSVAVNVEDANETLELRCTLDGEEMLPAEVAATHSTDYYGRMRPDAINRLDRMALVGFTDVNRGQAFMCEGKTILLDCRKTTAAGAGNLTACVLYGILESI